MIIVGVKHTMNPQQTTSEVTAALRPAVLTAEVPVGLT